MVDVIETFLRLWQQPNSYPQRDCISASKLTVEVFRRLGYKAEPRAVWLEVARLDSPNMVMGCPSFPKPIFGHVVAIAEGWLLDLTFGQFKSQEHRIFTPPAIAVPGTVWKTDVSYRVPVCDLVVTYTLRADEDWREQYESASVDAVNVDLFVGILKKTLDAI